MHHDIFITPPNANHGPRLESIVLGEVIRNLYQNEKIQPTREFASWMRLSLGLLTTMEKVWVEDSAVITRTKDAFELMTQALVGRGLLDKSEIPLLRSQWSPMLTDLCATVVRKAIDTGKLDVTHGLAFIEAVTLFGSNLTRPVPGSWLAQYCQEHPHTPIGLVNQTLVRVPFALRERASLGFVALAEHFKLIEPMEAVSVLKAYYGEMGIYEGNLDLTVDQAEVILETAGLGEHIPTLRHTLAGARAGYVVDGVWAELCSKPVHPQICTLVHHMPVGRAVIDTLVSKNLLTKSFIPALVNTMIGALR
jgi:hypothetical protein